MESLTNFLLTAIQMEGMIGFLSNKANETVSLVDTLLAIYESLQIAKTCSQGEMIYGECCYMGLAPKKSYRPHT